MYHLAVHERRVAWPNQLTDVCAEESSVVLGEHLEEYNLGFATNLFKLNGQYKI